MALGVFSAAALGAEPPSGGSLGSLVVPEVQTLDGGQQAQAAAAARRASPEARAAREKSRTAFRGLSAGAAEKLAGEAFPGVVDRPAGGPPQLPAGQRIVRYLTDNAATVELSGGKHAVIESLQPLAVETSPGHREPIDLNPNAASGIFQPARSDVGLRIPKRLADGVRLAGTGVSLTPVDASGSPLGGSEGVVDGVSVLYANTQTDTDALVKPTTEGFEADMLLRSPASPQQLYFRVGLPAGAKLVQAKAKDGSGAVRVVKEGVMIASIPVPVAQDAAGTAVPVSLNVSGDTLVLTVDHDAMTPQYPIDVDPEVDENLTGATQPTHWHFSETPQFVSRGWKESSGIVLETIGAYEPGQTGWLYYDAEGEARLSAVKVSANGHNYGGVETYLELSNGSNPAATKLLAKAREGFSGEYGVELGESAAKDNYFHFQEAATEKGERTVENKATVTAATVTIGAGRVPTVQYANTPKEVGGRHNVLYGNEWLSKYNGAFQVNATDGGIGISELKSWYPKRGGGVHEEYKPRRYFEEGLCEGVWCHREVSEVYEYSETNPPPDGEDWFEAEALNAFGSYGSEPRVSHIIKVDGTPPYGLALNGLPTTGIIDEGEFQLTARATDGKAPTPSSGIKSLALGLDGYELPGKSGSCTPGPCSATGEWTINGEQIGTGKHTLTLVATDNAGNVEKKEYTITVRHAAPLSVGPGSVDPTTGAMHLSATDVSIGASGGSLGVSRSYDSRKLSLGEGGPLGPQWKLTVDGAQQLEAEPEGGGVSLIAPDGSVATFQSNGKGGFTAPSGDENLVLSDEKTGETIKAYFLKDPALGTTVKYTQPAGSTSSSPWVISSTEGALSKTTGEKQAFTWERLEVEGKKIDEPKLALAAAPAGVTCSPEVKEPKELNVGCRALSFTYATKTTATGEGPSEWGEYNGRLAKVSFTAYNSATKQMETTPVAEYRYDKPGGRLRAEWDPRLSSPLKIIYGYDGEGHVVAASPPGQQPWLLHYGTTTNDAGAGRLLSVIRPPASSATVLKEQKEQTAPANTTAPTISTTTPTVGTTVKVASNGAWSNSPLAYNDSWENCYTRESKETCTAIPGAVNATYTLQARDAGYTLKLQVTAINASGATTATAAASKATTLGAAVTYSNQWGEAGEGEKQMKDPAGAATAGGTVGETVIWLADRGNNRLQEWNSKAGTFERDVGTKGTGNLQFQNPEGISINQSTDNIYVADKGNNRIEELNSTGGFVRVFGKGEAPSQLSAPEGVAVAPNGEVWVTDSGNNRVAEFSETGEYIGAFGTKGTGNGQFQSPSSIAFSGGNVYVLDSGNDRVEEFSTSGEFIATFGTKGTGEGQLEKPDGISAEPISGDLYVADGGNNRIEEFNPVGVLVRTFGKKGTGNGEFNEPQAIAVNRWGELCVPDAANSRVQHLLGVNNNSSQPPAPPPLEANSVMTIDYNVPLGGNAELNSMGKHELEQWGQTDDPAEPVPREPLATAIFPPSEPMGWPAQHYKSATITYFDEFGRVVNRATPFGGVSTSEYNEDNEVVRSLSADNRAAALKEGAKSAEVAELLDTKSKYNGETKEEKEKEEKEGLSVPGSHLLETTGPQHTIRLAGTTTEKQARNHVRYYYDEGAPKGETYNLVTKTTDGAEYEGKETEVRTTTNSYSGQEGLGWLLRKPTSVTTDPTEAASIAQVLDVTRTTLYNPITGSDIETRAPASESAGSIGSKGSNNGQLNFPEGVAAAPNGNVYVADADNDRIEEFTAAGAFVAKWGSYGTGNGMFKEPDAIAVAPSGNMYVTEGLGNRVQEFSSAGTYITQWGSEGTGNGEFKRPRGIAVALSGNVYVTDGTNDRVQEFTANGEYVRQWGTAGSGNGQFSTPVGVAVAPNGNVYVGDSSNERIQEFSATGTFVTMWYVNTDNGRYGIYPYGVAVAANGDVFAAEFGGERIEEFSATGTYIAKWGSSGPGAGQLKSPYGLAIAATGMLYVADADNYRVDKFAAGPTTPVQFGGMAGQFSEPAGVAVAPGGYRYYVMDTAHSRIDEYSESGEYLTAWGAPGSENGQFSRPKAVAVAPNGNVYVADSGNARVEEFTSSGEYVTQWGGLRGGPQGIAVASNGNVYVTNTEWNRVEEFTATGTRVKEWGELGTGNGKFDDPKGIAINPSGDVYVVDSLNNRVQEFTATGTYITQWGSKGTENGQFTSPEGIAITGSGGVYVADTGNERIQEFLESGTYVTKWGSEGSGNGQLKHPNGLAVFTNGNVVAVDTGNNRIEEFTGSGTYQAQTGSEGTASGQLKEATGTAVASNGNVYIADTGNNRIEEYSPSGEYLAQWGTTGSGNSQFKSPESIAVATNGNVYVADTGNNRIQEFSSTGTYITQWGSAGSENGQFNVPRVIAVAATGNVYVGEQSNDRIQEFTSSGAFVTKWGSAGSYNGQFSDPSGIAVAPNGTVYVTDTYNNRVQQFSASGTYIQKWGTVGSGAGQFKGPQGIAVAANGNVIVADTENSRVQEFGPDGEYVATFGSEGSGNGALKTPRGIAVAGSKTIYVADTGNSRIQKWLLPATEGPHDSQTIYYSAGYEARVSACDNHPEWVNLPCQSQPAAQPEGSLPKLPIVNTTYNMWDEPETVTENFGTTSRTKKIAYDAAGRLSTSEETSGVDTPLPAVTDKYNAETGALVEQSSTSGETTKRITSAFNTLGQLTEYTDANGSTTQYVYAGPANDNQIEEVKYGSKKGSEVYSYAPLTGALTKAMDVGPENGPGAGVFTATYDVEGKLISEGYPNGMTAKETYNATGEATGIEYEKTTYCTEKCTWFSESVIPSIHGEALLRAGTLAKEEYNYDEAGRLTEARETPTGGTCTTRDYAYDSESGRTSLTTIASEAGHECGTGSSTSESHTYDDADRLIDTGVTYETFGNQSKMPAADAGEHEITASFYVDNQVYVQKQNGETSTYFYDPAGRTETTVSEGSTNSTTVNHYAGPEETISWISEGTEKWTRNVPGIGGELSATENSGQAAVLQLHDLGGNIVATAGLSETETKLLSSYNSTEFGVQVNGTPPTKYSWLGASGLATEGSSTATASGGSSYVPQLGRTLQTQPIALPSLPPSVVGPYASTESAEDIAAGLASGAQAPAREAARQATLRREAEEAEARARANQPPGAIPSPGEGGVEEGPGEETFGDPTHCYVGGQLIEADGKAIIDGSGGCSQGLPAGSWIKVCVEDRSEFGPNFPKCNQSEVKGHTSRYHAIGNSAAVSCSGGDLFVGYVAFYVPGGRTLYATLKQGECGAPYTEDLESVSQFGFEEYISIFVIGG
jgi:DNA-binding beta-propeller fold protein YncE